MDNLDKLLEAVEHPERFTESELQTLLSDPETKQLYRLMCAMRANAYFADSAQDESEINREWENLMASRHKKKSIFTWLLQRKTAAIITFLIASYSIIMVGVSLTNSRIERTPADEGPSSATKILTETGLRQMKEAVKDTVIIFEDVKLDRILTEIAPYYNVGVDLKSPASKEIRLFLKWDSTTGLPELIEHLNSFERINLFLQEDTITDY